ncbi:class I SAM-dependent methyltransferase [Seonamhaeicola maritimus]|uniref:class I SAM-dependent methyltransferase n=1 Tax=Seonamhaeicola maritimus TaxID=2591822 RepID=UPI002494C69A|nr:class I SAM-dependent methyltransferase [Seonamhaeicola maritimus]
MKLPRDFTNVFNWILDNLIPPIIRDSRLLVKPFFWLIFKNKGNYFLNFKDKVIGLGHNELIDYYKKTSAAHIQRETDLNKKSIAFILNNIVGDSVLDISCGRGYLSKKIVEELSIEVTGVDFIIDSELKNSKNPLFLEGSIENIPYPDKHFDTVISTHTLEHVKDIHQAIRELRRVCKKRLIIVVPKQREYKYTFDLHVHFFPYKHSILKLMQNKKGACLCLSQDWLYYE